MVRFAAEYGLAAVGNSDAHAASAVGVGYSTFPGRTAEELRVAILERQTHWHGSFHDSRGQLGTFGRQLRKYSRDARDEVAGRLRRNGTGRDHGYPGGRLRPPRYEPVGEAGDAKGRRVVKIGLVTPYVYPLPGGVNEHVRYLYAGLRSRGHDVRIISSSHGLQRSSEGDVIRLGKGFSMPANGSVGTITLSPRYLSQVGAMLEREAFDLLHFHEPFVPFLSPIVLRASNSVNIATFHAFGGWSPAYQFGSRAMRGYADRLHGRIAVSAAARHFIDRFFPGDYKVIPNGVDVARFRDAVPIARWQDGVSNILFVGRHEPRKGLLDLLKAHRILRKTGCNCRLLIVGTGPQEREARRYVLTRRMSGVEFLGRVSDEEKAQLFRTADVYVSPATGGESFGIVLLEAMAAGAPIVASDIHGYKGVAQARRAGAARPAAQAQGDRGRRRGAPGRSGPAGADERERAGPGRGVQLGPGHGQGRGVLRVRHPPPGGRRRFAARLPRPGPAAPPRTSPAAGAAASTGGAAAAATISAIAEAQLEDVAEA